MGLSGVEVERASEDRAGSGGSLSPAWNAMALRSSPNLTNEELKSDTLRVIAFFCHSWPNKAWPMRCHPACASDAAFPDNLTTPLEVLTLIPAPFNKPSLDILLFTWVVICESDTGAFSFVFANKLLEKTTAVEIAIILISLK